MKSTFKPSISPPSKVVVVEVVIVVVLAAGAVTEAREVVISRDDTPDRINSNNIKLEHSRVVEGPKKGRYPYPR